MLWIWLTILLGLAVAMFVAELFIPSGGLLAILGAGCMTGAIVVCFKIDRWLGTGLLVSSVVIAPFAIGWGVSLWQKTFIGKRMVLSETVGQLPKIQVLIGSVGIALTEMRPMGEVEVGDTKIEAQSEMGMIIPAGCRVKVLSISGGIATVREIKDSV